MLSLRSPLPADPEVNGEAWSPQDVEVLLELIGDLPLPFVTQQHRRWAKGHGRPLRTFSAVTTKCKLLGISSRSTGLWITAGTVARYLGISSSRVVEWIHREGGHYKGIHGHLRARRFPHKPRKGTKRVKRRAFFWIHRAELRAFALLNPRLFGRLDRATLVELLDQERAADAVLRTAQSDRGPWQPVRCVETGITYPSLAHAARAVFVARTTLRGAARHGTRAAGLHWELI